MLDFYSILKFYFNNILPASWLQFLQFPFLSCSSLCHTPNHPTVFSDPQEHLFWVQKAVAERKWTIPLHDQYPIHSSDTDMENTKSDFSTTSENNLEFAKIIWNILCSKKETNIAYNGSDVCVICMVFAWSSEII